MQVKDWIILLVPILCNGVIIFILQKIFEKKQISRTIKFEYASIFRQKIDVSLEVYSNILKLENNGNVQEDMIINALQKYIDSVMELYYYYVQNEYLFKVFKNDFERIIKYILQLNTFIQKDKTDLHYQDGLFHHNEAQTIRQQSPNNQRQLTADHYRA